MFEISKNKYLDALFKLMLLSASVHMIILIVFTILKFDFSLLNYFRILELDIIFPSLKTKFGEILGLITAIVLYLIILVFYTDNKKSKK
ncbi:MAG: hypothetical protein ACMXYG_01260 [Candidatus Woesearchaeota archaeon]